MKKGGKECSRGNWKVFEVGSGRGCLGGSWEVVEGAIEGVRVVEDWLNDVG